MSPLTALERAHLLCYSCVASEDGELLAVATNTGAILLYSLRAALRSASLGGEVSAQACRPLACLPRPAGGGGVYSLAATPDFLLAGGLGGVRAWRWAALVACGDNAGADLACAWEKSLPVVNADSADRPEVNALLFEPEAGLLMAACGDRRVHLLDCAAQHWANSLSGHQDYVHDLALLGGDARRLLTACEDGAARLFDTRATNAAPQVTLAPHKQPELARPPLGRWLTCVAADRAGEDWLALGGGPRLSLWHLRAQRHTSVLETDAVEGARGYTQTARFTPDGLVSAGSRGCVVHWELTGRRCAEVRVSAPHVMHLCAVPELDAQLGDAPRLAVCGADSRVDVCSQLGYVLLSLHP